LLSAFISSGVENLAGGLWELPDEASKLFILDIYRSLIRGNDLAAARQAAAQHAISMGHTLRSWAGLELVGPGRSLGLTKNN
jgi:CHAT domain-containing protein